jgi:hypothetical protein
MACIDWDGIEMLLDRQRFQQWLLESDGVVGYASDPDECPVARFLHDCGVPARVGGCRLRVGDEESLIFRSGWVIDFVTALDQSCLWTRRACTGEQCLAVLARLGGDYA